MKKIIFAVLIVALIGLAGCQQQGNVINVDGNSEITVDPDEAEVWAGVSVVDVSADLAQEEVNKIINDIVDGLRYKGISEDDMSTERLSIYEERRWEEGKSKVVGWRATQILKIKTTDMNKVGTIVDVAVDNGANQIQNINFGLSSEKEAEYKKQAIAEATKNAKEKAETIADSLGVRLGKIKTVSTSDYYYRPYAYAMEKASGDEAVAEAAVVMPGDVTVTARIILVYGIG
ncbi:SIMPL domain-containing protein [Candidatus Woesearchaeota archaeon]|nr:SIMPL domain-containing protein [Candidatus Woesearchaeota archaeon]